MKRQELLLLLSTLRLDRWERLGNVGIDTLIEQLTEIRRKRRTPGSMPTRAYLDGLIEYAKDRGSGRVLAAELPGDEDFELPGDESFELSGDEDIELPEDDHEGDLEGAT